MSAVGSHISQLWNEILKHHWLYLESEESLKKLEQRKQLEAYLQQLLSVVRHDRKFYLPETALALKDSVCTLKDFNIQKAILAFEAISQYANNLFTKPWRKEFHTLKTYSGFFQHEIKSNLLGADKLFEAMGYRFISEQIMILDGPICPDQVTNVSRDAMTAYMELQIIKRIGAGLDGLNYNVTWLDIYLYRENHVGDAAQAIRSLIYLIQRQQYMESSGNKTKLLPTDNYDYIDVQSNGDLHTGITPLCQCQFRTMGHTCYMVSDKLVHCDNIYKCATMHQQQQRQTLPRSNNSIVAYNNINTKRDGNYHRSAQVSHTRSLDHYVESNARVAAIMPQTHSYSFEQHPQQFYASTTLYPQHHLQHYPTSNCYDSLLDDADNSLDESSTISYATVAKGSNHLTMNTMSNNHQLYNVSGNRYPLPYNISHQFSKYYDQSLSTTPTPTSTTDIEPLYAVASGSSHIYATVTKPHQNYRNKAGENCAIVQRQCSSQTCLDQFPFNVDSNCIKLNNCPDCVISNDVYNHSGQLRGGESCHLDKGYHDNLTTNKILMMATYQRNPNNETGCDRNVGITAEVYPEEDLARRKLSSYHHRNTMDDYVVDTNHHYDNNIMNTNERDYIGIGKQQQNNSLIQLSHKNQDGVGSFESWDYVFQHLKQNGNNNTTMDTPEFNKDADAHDIDNDNDFFLNTLHITNPIEHEHLCQGNNYANYNNTGAKSKMNRSIVNPHNECKMTSTKGNGTNNRKQQQIELPQQQLNQKLKSYQKQSNEKQLQCNNNYSSSSNNNNSNNKNNNSGNNNNDCEQGSVIKQIKEQKNDRKQKMTITNTSSEATTLTTALPNEWNCRFCTFLNPVNKRICEMCCHTKDFDLESDKIAQQTPTCV